MEYISEMVQLISTGNDEVDQQNIELVAENILAKALQMHKEYVAVIEANLKELNKKIGKMRSASEEMTELLEQQAESVSLLEQSKKTPKKEEVIEYLNNLRQLYLDEVAKGRDPDEVSSSLSSKIFSGGMTTMQAASMSIKSTTIAATTAAQATTTATVSGGLSAAAPGPLGLIVSGAVFSA